MKLSALHIIIQCNNGFRFYWVIGRYDLHSHSINWQVKLTGNHPEKARFFPPFNKYSYIHLYLCDNLFLQTVEELKKSYIAFYNNYKYVSTESFLIEHGIADDKFFALCKDPIKLIYELYYEYGDKVTFETGRLTGVPGKYLYL